MPLSYRLHAKLAEEHGGDKRWGYRQVYCGSITAKAQTTRPVDASAAAKGGKTEEWQKLPKVDDESKMKNLKKRGVPKDLDWIIPEAIREYDPMGTPEDTAQVHPYYFTKSMAELAQEKGGVDVKEGAHVDSIDYTGGHVKSVTYTDKQTKKTHTMQADDVIISAGPWTSHVFPDVSVSAMRAHSVTIKADVSPYALFSEIDLPEGFTGSDGKPKRRGARVSPEMYARPNNEVYCCGKFSQPTTP